MKLDRDFHREGEHHRCRACGVKLARLVDGALQPLGSLTHVVFLLESGTFYRVNMCKSCAKNLDLKDPKVVFSFWANDLARWPNRKELAKDKPLPGFAVIETSNRSLERLLELKKRFLNAR